MFFFRKAQSLYRNPPPKELSPAFWESEDRSPTEWEGFTAVLPAIEHELGRCHCAFRRRAHILMHPKIARKATVHYWGHC